METRTSITADLRSLGVEPGRTLMVHSSLSALGYVLGGAPTVIWALVDAIGPRGTLVMPAFSPQVSDPVTWPGLRLSEQELAVASTHAPSFDSETTPTTTGAIPEAFRRWPGTRRSPHPQVSITARGPLAAKICSEHPLSFGEGSGSPFEKLYEIDADVLLLGVGYNRATILHFAESQMKGGRLKTRRFPLDEPNGRRWVEVPDVGDDLDTHFPEIGHLVSEEELHRSGLVGAAQSSLISASVLVDRARSYMKKVFAV